MARDTADASARKADAVSQQPAPRPHDPEAERAVLGGILLDNTALPKVAGILSADDFYEPRHGVIFEAMAAVAAGGSPIDLLTLASELRARERLNTIGGAQYLGEITDTLPTAAHVESHAQLVADAAAARRQWEAIVGAAHELRRPGAPAEQLARAQTALATVPVTEHGWPAPTPLGETRPPPWPRGVLPGWLGTMVAALAEATQVPEDLPALLGLAVLSAAIAGTVVVEARPGWIEPVNLFVAVALPPGSRKSEVFRQLAAPLLAAEQQWVAAHGAHIARTQSDVRVAETALRSAERTLAMASDEQRENARTARDEALRELDAARAALADDGRRVTDDATPEALASLLATHHGRFAVLSAEGAGLFDMMAGRYTNPGNRPNLDVYLKGHAGDTLRVDRRGRPPEFVARPALTCGVAVQPDALRALASRPELRGRGLPARFLYGVPPSNLGLRSMDPPSPRDDVVETYARGIDALRALEAPDGPRVLQLHDAACGELHRLRGSIEQRVGTRGDLAPLADWGSKLPGAVVRIAGLLHCAICVDAGLMPWQYAIAGDTMERAAYMAEEYLVPHARLAFDVMTETVEVRAAQTALAWLTTQRRPVVTARELHRGMNARGRREDVLDPALGVLLAHGYLRELERETTGRGRPTERYEVHPQVLRGTP